MATAHARKKASPARLLMSLGAVTMVGVVGVVGTQAALSDTTDNSGNEFNAGEIDITDNDGGASFMYQVENALPGDTVSRCIQVSYTSTPNLDSTVELYMATPIGTVGSYVDMTVEVGTQTSPVFPDCTDFAADENIYTGTLSAFQATHNSPATGLAYSPHGVGTPWEDTDSVVYRVTLTLQNTVRGTGENFSNAHTYTWQADAVV
jgi:hypothetical protein